MQIIKQGMEAIIKNFTNPSLAEQAAQRSGTKSLPHAHGSSCRWLIGYMYGGAHLGDSAPGTVPAGLLVHFLGQSGQLRLSTFQDTEAPQMRSQFQISLPLLGTVLMCIPMLGPTDRVGKKAPTGD